MGLAVSTGTKVEYGTRFSEENQACTICLEIKPAEDFPKRENGKRKSWCRVCWNKWRRKYRKDNTDATKAEYYRDNLARACKSKGITKDDFFHMYNEQDKRCAICENEFNTDGRRPAIDHCHKTDKVRGLLCLKCNTAIGLLDDNIQYLSSAIQYIKEHAE